MIYGYARVSTAGQSINGNSLEDQTRALEAYGCQEIVTEAFSGKSMERPRFSALFQRLQPGDTLVVTKLDRFARTAIGGVSAVRELFERGVRVHILNMGLIENTLTGNLILTVMLTAATGTIDNDFALGILADGEKVGVFLFTDGETSILASQKNDPCFNKILGTVDGTDNVVRVLISIIETCDPSLTFSEVKEPGSEALENGSVTQNGVTYVVSIQDDGAIIGLTIAE